MYLDGHGQSQHARGAAAARALMEAREPMKARITLSVNGETCDLRTEEGG
jgi:hypothetical protein